MISMLPYNAKLKERSRQLRENMTDAERLIWSKVRMKQINGVQFYRQKPIGGYILDFYCPKAKLAIDIDGGQHLDNENVNYDRRREQYLLGMGLKVLRFTNVEILENIEGVIDIILSKIPLNPPLLKGQTGKGLLVDTKVTRDSTKKDTKQTRK